MLDLTETSVLCSQARCRILRPASSRNCPNAQAAWEATNGGLSDRCRSNSGSATGSLQLPVATQTVRIKPSHFARFTALPRKRLAKASWSSESKSSRGGAMRSGCGCRRGWLVAGALPFQGHTSWHRSQPNTQFPICDLNSTGISLRSSMVR